jgi:septum formation protein
VPKLLPIFRRRCESARAKYRDYYVDLLLASKSPRRRELLEQIGVRFGVLDVQVPELRAPSELPQDYVQRLASEKSQAGSLLRPDLPVLGADTIVVLADQVLEKPATREEALAMLAQLSGSTHEVYTAIAITHGLRQARLLCCTEVTFREISPSEAERYWHTGEACDKAGGYGIQGMAAVFVANLRGSYSNVVGLPLMETQQLLARFNVSVWMPRL